VQRHQYTAAEQSLVTCAVYFGTTIFILLVAIFVLLKAGGVI
jgi:hypothetical protein